MILNNNNMEKVYRYFIITLCALFSAYFADAQEKSDVIYQFNGEKINCLFRAITDDWIQYNELDNLNGPTYNIFKSDVALIYGINGKYLLPHLSDTTWIEVTNNELNRIITKDGQIIPVTWMDFKSDKVMFKKENTTESTEMSKSEIIAVAYTDGTHEVFSQLNENTNISENPIIVDESTPNSEINKYLELDGVDLDEYTEKALNKTKDLGWYLQILTDKEEDELDKIKAIDMACQLFIHNADSSYVEVSSINRTARRQY